MKFPTAKEAAEMTKEATKRIEREGYKKQFLDNIVRYAQIEGRCDFSTFRLNERHEEVYRTICEEYGYELKILGDLPSDQMLFVRWIKNA